MLTAISSVISRRKFVLGMLAQAGLVASLSNFALARTSGAATRRALKLTAEQIEGPFYLDLKAIRKNIVEDRRGVPLALHITVQDIHGLPVNGAYVDIWHCDASGIYSGFNKMSAFGGPPPGAGGPPFGPGSASPPHGPADALHGSGKFPGGLGPFGPGMHMQPTDKKTFLRGTQITDASGSAIFDTIYPGWYSGRALHIHSKVHISGGRQTSPANHVCHTGQIFFPESVNRQVARLAFYDKNSSERVLNAQDMIYGRQDGAQSLAEIAPLKADTPALEYSAQVIFIVDPKAVSS